MPSFVMMRYSTLTLSLTLTLRSGLLFNRPLSCLLSHSRFILVGDHDTHFVRFPDLAEQCRAVAPDLKIDGPVYSGILYNIMWYLRMSEFEKAVILANIRLSNEASKKTLGIK